MLLIKRLKQQFPHVASLFCFFLLNGPAYAQQPVSISQAQPVDTIIIAGKQYERRPSYRKLWGEHYRKEWTIPVKVKLVRLDTLVGGLTPYERGGGRQTKTLRLRDAQGREYVLRSIDKSFGKALPEIYQGTLIETIINDQVSIGHPYTSITIPPMAEAVKIYYTNPEIIFLPEQPALDSFNKEYANQLFLFEQRPDENWETATNFGNAKNIVGTEKMLEELMENNEHRVDQLVYVRSRLFDIFIGDWSRHEDQWRWAEFEKGDEKIFLPIARDRDQAFTKFDGKLLSLLIPMAGLKHLQSFDSTLKDVRTFNFSARNLDRRLTNETTLEQWTEIAKNLQQVLDDKLIENAVKKLPPEVFPLSGNELISKLKSRRNHLVQFAADYYKFLAKDVDVVGSDKKEYFNVTRVNDNETLVKVYKIKKDGSIKKEPIFSRRFLTSETKEVRLYGQGENDIFMLEGTTRKGILIRIVAGKGNDSIQDKSMVGGAKKLTRIYDDQNSSYITSTESRLHISKDSAMNSYQYNSFEYDDKGFKIKPGFFSLSFGFGDRVEKWRKEPAGYEQSIKLKYSINRAAINIEYNGNFYQALGNWNIGVTAGAGVPTVVNFFGIGNESSFITYDRSYFRLRSQEFYGKLGINRSLGSHFLAVNSFYQTVKIKQDAHRFINDFIHINTNGFDLERKHFVGGEVIHKYQHTDDAIVPTKGFKWQTSASYTHNLNIPDHSFSRISTDANVYIPVIKFISLAFRAGGATNGGNAEFYQLNRLGSDENLRGYRKQRFYGRHSFYNNNELRLIFNTRNKVFNGKIGLIGFYDIGRVWHPGEDSDQWHAGYGPGIFLSLFKKATLSAAYGFSKDDRVISAYFGFYF